MAGLESSVLKDCSILFASIKGVDTNRERVFPQKVLVMLDDFFRKVKDVCEAHEGHVEKFSASGVMVSFDIFQLQPRDDHPVRALRTALELIQALRQQKQTGAAFLRVCFGVESGQAVVKRMPEVPGFEYQLMGDNVKYAIRLASAQTHDRLFIGPKIYGRVHHLYPTQVLPPLKQGTETIPVIEVKV